MREVVVHGVLDISGVQTAAICGLLFILGALLIVCAKTPHMDCISANTKLCPTIYQGGRDTESELEFRCSQNYEDTQL